MPVGEAIALCGNDEAGPFAAFKVFGDHVELVLGGAAFERGGDWFGGPVAGGDAQQVAAMAWVLSRRLSCPNLKVNRGETGIAGFISQQFPFEYFFAEYSF